ncbi:MAG: xanthine dehydrogenase family protein molybdopterin-binding subunit [Nitrososphaerota archaeon]
MYVGQSIKSGNLRRHITGLARFLDDMTVPNMLYCGFIRSTYPHARIRGLDFGQLPNGAAVITWRELERFAQPYILKYPYRNFKPLAINFLAKDKVRYVGEPIAAILSTDRYQLQDLIETVNVDYEPLPPLINPLDAQASDIHLYDDWESNSMVKFTFRIGDVDEALKSSPIVVSERFITHRQTAAPMETRGCVAHYDWGRNILTTWVSNQNPHIHRAILAEMLYLPENKIHVIAPDMGGGFGLKCHTSPEDIVTCVASMITGRPVKWVESRRENLTASSHSREQVHDIKVGATRDGLLTVIVDEGVIDLGATILFPHDSLELAIVVMGQIPGPYRLRNYFVELDCVVTNKSPSGAYRGFGHPEATFVRERALDIVARECGLDPAEVRLRNLVGTGDIPYTCPTGLVIDSGDPKQTLVKAIERVREWGVDTSGGVRSESILGLGMACSLKGAVPTMLGTTGKWGASEATGVKITPDGKVVVTSGAVSMGTQLDTALSQLVADTLGVALQDVEVILGDSELAPFSTGLWGSRGAVMCGGAAVLSARKLREKILTMTAHLLDSRVEDLDIKSGSVFVKDDPTRFLTFAEIARIAYNEPYKLPQDFDTSLEAVTVYDPPNISREPDELGRFNAVGAVSAASAIALIELDKETCQVRLLRLLFVENGGTYINPSDVNNQLVGGITQSLAGTLYEEIVYSPEGIPLTSTLADYAIPTALETPTIEIDHIISPSPHTILGLKGVGETGTIPVMAAIANAVQNALEKAGWRAEIRRSMLSPAYLWKMVKA